MLTTGTSHTPLPERREQMLHLQIHIRTRRKSLRNLAPELLTKALP